MANYRTISVNFWTDSKVDDEFTPEEKYFYLYLLTNPHTNICGCYEIGTKQMERETGYNTDTIKRLIDRMERTHGVIRYSPETKEILIVNWGRYNWSRSEKVKRAVLEVASHIKSGAFRAYVIDTVSLRYAYHSDTSVTDTVSDTDTDTVSETVTETVTEYRYSVGDADKPHPARTRTSFQQPTVEEVAAYCKERGNKVDPQRFVDYYTANGWTQGHGKKIKDWKACVRTWEQADKQRNAEKAKEPAGSFQISDFDKLVNRFPDQRGNSNESLVDQLFSSQEVSSA